MVGVADSVGGGTSVGVSEGGGKVTVSVLAGANGAQALHRRMNRKLVDKWRKQDSRMIRSLRAAIVSRK
jgi:hypothetical protein